VIEGTVIMDKNYTLEADEVSRGFVLSCQAHATTEKLVISFDDR
jgi:ring-1,2-phenylacetyl-CoA epoxidase subunit PaaE